MPRKIKILATHSVVTCIYTCRGVFTLPNGVTLLSVEDNRNADETTPFSWWIRYDELHWIDKDGVQHTVTGEREIEKLPDEDTEQVDEEEDE
jgi:hypothetical protein